MNISDLPKIAGKFEAPRMWQIGVGIAAVAGIVVIYPVIKDAMVGKKKAQIAEITHAGQTGEHWHAPEFPQPAQPVAQRTLPPPPDLKILTLPKPTLAATDQTFKQVLTGGAKAEKPVDIEQEMANSPIRMGGAQSTDGAVQHVNRTTTTESGLGGSQGGDTAIGALLKPTQTSGYTARRMRHRDMTIEDGRHIACQNVSAMTSGLSGFVTAQVTYDQWSADDTTRLIESESTVTGEIAHGLVNGQDKLFVLWREIRTPKPGLVRVTLNSPATDEIGEAGLGGPDEVNHHRWQKIGGAVLLSGIDMTLQGLSSGLSNAISGNQSNNSRTQNQGVNFYQLQGQGSNLASQLLASTISIPDTMHIDQSQPCSIYVAGDLLFDDVYVTTMRERMHNP